MHYMELSSKTGHNVELAFYKMALNVHKMNTRPNSREGSASRKNSSAASDHSSRQDKQDMMQDRVRLTPSNV